MCILNQDHKEDIMKKWKMTSMNIVDGLDTSEVSQLHHFAKLDELKVKKDVFGKEMKTLPSNFEYVPQCRPLSFPKTTLSPPALHGHHRK